MSGDAAELAQWFTKALHPDRDPQELDLLPWFGQPLIGSVDDEVLVLAHPDRVALLADEVRDTESR